MKRRRILAAVLALLMVITSVPFSNMGRVEANAAEAFEYLSSDELTGYADSACGDSNASKAVDGDYSTQWHSNYNDPETLSDDPYPMDEDGNIGSGKDLAQNNNFYIVLAQPKTVKGISVYLEAARNANIKHLNIYVSGEEYVKGETLDWGEKAGGTTGDGIPFSYSDTNTEIALDEVQDNVKSIRIEITQTYGVGGTVENMHIRCREFGVLASAAEEPEMELVMAYLDSELLTGYADSSIGDASPSNAVDGDTSTQWHSNYADPDNQSADPFPCDEDGNIGSGKDLAQNNNFYIVLAEEQIVGGISVYLQAARNANIRHLNIYVSSEEYVKGETLDWGEKVGGTTGDGIPFSYSDTNTEIALDEVQDNVKSIRIEITQTYGLGGTIENQHIRCREFGVLAGTWVEVEPEPTPEPTPDPDVVYEYEYLSCDALTGYADSSCIGGEPSKALDGALDTNWHTNYQDDTSQSEDPFVQSANGILVANNNYYIVLDEVKPVDKISIYTDERNGAISMFNVYISSDDYGVTKEINWGSVVGSTPDGGWPLAGGQTREIVFDEPLMNVKTIRLEFKKVHGNDNIRGIEFGVSAGTAVETEMKSEFVYLDFAELTGYADSAINGGEAERAVDGDIGTNWHTNYQDENMSDDPLVVSENGYLVANNNFYIVLNEAKTVDKISIYVDERNAAIRSFNVYVSSEDYGTNQEIAWGDIIASTPSGGFAHSSGRTEEVVFDVPQENVKTIRLEFTQVYGDSNIRGIEFGVSAETLVPVDPEEPDDPVVDPEEPKEKPEFTMAVIGDLHIDAGIERWDPPMRAGAITVAERMAQEEEVDLVAFTGDNVSSHLGSYWGSTAAEKKATFDNVKAAMVDVVNTASETGRGVYVTGNHDFLVGGLAFNAGDYINEMETSIGALVPAEDVTDVEANAYFQSEFPAGTASGLEHVLAYHYTIDNLDFIMINTPYQMDENVYYYDEASLEWIGNKLADIGAEQTVFMVGHYPLNTDRTVGDLDPASHNILKEEILDNYPNVIYIYGHHHTQVIREDTYERVTAYDSEGNVYQERTENPTGFVTTFGGSVSYYGDEVIPTGNLSSATANVVQALLVYVYKDRIELQMKNYGVEDFGVEEIQPYIIWRDVAAEDDVAGLKEALKEAQAAAEAAKILAEEAKAEAAQAKADAEAAKAAAEAAAATSADNKEAAEAAKAAAEAAQVKAEEAQAAAEEAQANAEAAKEAAQEANVEAAQEALAAAEEALKAAEAIAEAAKEALAAAQAQEKAQEAQAKAEAAQAAAEEAKARAEAATEAAENAAETTAMDKSAVEAAKAAAENAKEAAAVAQREAESAKQAAAEAASAADASNKEAAQEAAKAAQLAADAAEQANNVAKYAAEAAQAQEKAQEAQAKAEEAQEKAEEAQKKAEEAAEQVKKEAELESVKQQALLDIMLYAMDVDAGAMSEKQFLAYKDAMTTVVDAVDKAEQKEEIEEAIAAFEELVEKILKTGVFEDVEEGRWFYDAVYYVNEKGFMVGMTDTLFEPNTNLTRAQFAVILHRIAGGETVNTDHAFADMTGEEWYGPSVLWAVETGVVSGYKNGNFGPKDNITREQMVLMMYRYALYLEKNVNNEGDYSAFVDGDKVSSYASEAMNWGVDKGIITGKAVGDMTLIDPQGNTTRAECASIIQRFMENIVK